MVVFSWNLFSSLSIWITVKGCTIWHSSTRKGCYHPCSVLRVLSIDQRPRLAWCRIVRLFKLWRRKRVECNLEAIRILDSTWSISKEWFNSLRVLSVTWRSQRNLGEKSFSKIVISEWWIILIIILRSRLSNLVAWTRDYLHSSIPRPSL